MEKRSARAYRIALAGLGILSLVTLVLLVIALNTVHTRQMEKQAVLDELAAQQAAWTAQNITDYQVNYSACNYQFCCTGETIQVQDGLLAPLPVCAANYVEPTYGKYLYDIHTMDELYTFLSDFMRYNTVEDVIIEYDDEQHYITSFTVTYFDVPVRIEYADLTPQG